MIKLLTLKNVSPYAEDALFKICLNLDKLSITEDTGYENYDELLEGAKKALAEGVHVIVAAETANYNQLKDTFISELSIRSETSEELLKFSTEKAGDKLTGTELNANALLPEDGVCFRTNDGLYCGFTCAALSGTLTFMPLDFMRIDTVLTAFCSYMETGKVAKAEKAEKESSDSEFDFTKSVAKLVNTLAEEERRVALVTGEATMWIYNL